MSRSLAAIAWAMCGAAHACGTAGDTLATGAHYTIAFRTAPSPIRTGEHFAIDFTVCSNGKAPLPRAVRVDASMPEHRHGMNYKPTVVAKAPGRYRAEGLLFHMGGRWELTFDLARGTETERIAVVLQIE